MKFRKPFSLSNHPPQQKEASFYIYVQRALHISSDPSNLLNELNYLKSLALSRGYNPPVIGKTLNKFKKPEKKYFYNSDPCLNPIILPLYSLLSFKISKTISRFRFKVSFRPVNKIKFSSPKELIPIENRSGVHTTIPFHPTTIFKNSNGVYHASLFRL